MAPRSSSGSTSARAGDTGPDQQAAIRAAERWAAAAEAAQLRLQALDAAIIAISQEVSLERVLQLIVDSVRPLVGARYAALGIPDEHGHMERFITSGIDEAERHAIGHPPRGLGLLGEIIRSGVALRVPVLADHPRSVGFPEHHPTMTSFLGVPVRVEGRAVGNLYLTEKQGQKRFSEDDQRLVESFARHAGLAIHNARMHEELRQMAVLQERERIAQDLHDGSIQSLYAVSLTLEDAAEMAVSDPLSSRPVSIAPSSRYTTPSVTSANSSWALMTLPRRSTCSRA